MAKAPWTPSIGDTVEVTWVDIEARMDASPNDMGVAIFTTKGEYEGLGYRIWNKFKVKYLYVRGGDYDEVRRTHRELNAIPVAVVLDIRPSEKGTEHYGTSSVARKRTRTRR